MMFERIKKIFLIHNYLNGVYFIKSGCQNMIKVGENHKIWRKIKEFVPMDFGNYVHEVQKIILGSEALYT